MTFSRIAILGAGAVGAYYGGRLAAAGHAVDFFTRSDAAAMKQHGLRVRSTAGDFTIDHPSVFDDVKKMPKADLVIVSLKATAKADYVRLVRPVMHDRSVILCLQNGLGNEEVFAEAFPNTPVLGANAYTCINRVGPGEIEHTAHGLLRIGAFANADFALAESIAELMKPTKIDAVAVADLHHYRWQKLLWNIPFNGWGAALDRHSAQMLANADGIRLVRDTMSEVINAAASVGVKLDPSEIDGHIHRTGKMGDYHSSMQLDRQAGRAMEVDAVIAEPLRRAKAAGCGALPLIETMLRCLKAF